MELQVSLVLKVAGGRGKPPLEGPLPEDTARDIVAALVDDYEGYGIYVNGTVYFTEVVKFEVTQ